MDVSSQLVFQGIDTDLFRPQNKRIFRDRFVVFSGGKLEHRKGQDQLVKAFSIFAETHPDALLISAWRSPWEKDIARTVNKSGLCEDLLPLEDMGVAISNWIGANGIRPDQFMSLDSVPNRLMPDIYREVDLAVFPNRCEGGTNLVAMEALSSGVTCIIANNTGQMDLIMENNCLPLTEQTPLTDPGIKFSEDWRDSSVDEIVALMEAAYDNKAILEATHIRDSMIGYSWENSITTLIQTIHDI